MPVPQLIHANNLTRGWPQAGMDDAHGKVWVLARPYALGNIWTRATLAWKVFTGQCDALKWYRQ